MPLAVYEIVAQAARYWFLFLMLLIVWRSYRWYRKSRRQQKKRLRLLPDAGYVGEMVVVEGGGRLPPGTELPVPWEGILGSGRGADIQIPGEGVQPSHCWFSFTQKEGLRLEPCRGCRVTVDGAEGNGATKEPLCMRHGSRLYVGEVQLRLRMFAGFETAAYARRAPEPAQPQGGGSAAPAWDPLVWEQWRQAAMQQALQQQQYMQWLAAQQAARQAEAPPAEDAVWDGEALPEIGEADYASQTVEFASNRPFFPPETDGETGGIFAPWPEESASSEEEYQPFADEDLTDAASPSRRDYTGEDETEEAKRAFWDRYLGGNER